MGRQRIEVAEAQHPRGRVWRAPLQNERSWVRGGGANDVRLRTSGEGAQSGVLVDAEREDEILGGEGRSIVPDESVAQPVDGLHTAIRGGPPALSVKLGQGF